MRAPTLTEWIQIIDCINADYEGLTTAHMQSIQVQYYKCLGGK